MGLGRSSATASHWEGSKVTSARSRASERRSLLDLLESVPHQARLHALEPVAPPVEPRQVFGLPVPERVAGAVGGRQFPFRAA